MKRFRIFIVIIGIIIPIIFSTYFYQVNAAFIIEDNLPTNDSFKWYKIEFEAGDTIYLNVSSKVKSNFDVGVIISPSVQPDNNIGATIVLVGKRLNSTQNVSIIYKPSNNQQMIGLYLLIISLNDTNPANFNYTISCSNNIIHYSYDLYYKEVQYPMVLLFASIFVIIGAAVTGFIIFKWYKSKRVKLI